MLNTWLPVVSKKPEDSFRTGKLLYSESELMELHGLLNGDALYIEKAVLIKSAVTVQLFIDPTANVLHWLIDICKKNGTQATVVPRGHERLSSELALDIRFGKTLIITETHSIDAINVGHREIDYNDNFKLFLITCEPQPKLHPTIEGHSAIVNFSVTHLGIQSTLLSLTLERAPRTPGSALKIDCTGIRDKTDTFTARSPPFEDFG